MDIGAISKPLGQNSTPANASGPAASVPAAAVPPSEPEEGTRSVTAASKPDKAMEREQIEDAVASIQEFVQSVRRSINFSVEDGSGRVVVKVTDAESGNVIRQIPSEEALKLAENLSEVRSLLFEAEA